MKTYTVMSSETIAYRTTIKADSEEQAMDIFYNTRIVDESKLVPEFYEGFQVDSITEE